MNEPEKNPSSGQPVSGSYSYSENANEKVESLRYQMNLLFGCLLIASFTLTAYLGVQARRASMDLIALKGPADQSMQLVQQDNAAVEVTIAKLTEFAHAHPDFQKVVLSKYRLNTNTPPAAPAAALPAKK
jgi:hypothetical protein